MEGQKTRVAVIGAGVTGLIAVKECIETGFDVECFEASDHIGGQWAYQDCTLDADVSKVWSSIYAGTMLNSCRDTTALSDFPLDPSRYGDYFNHRQFLRYLNEYVDYFGLIKHVRLRSRVVRSEPRDDGRWVVCFDDGSGKVEEKSYDAVFACTGHVSIPQTPEFKGRELFKGQVFHSHVYRTPGPFEGKSVAILGIGSSAVDIACEIAPTAKEVHVITRRGAWILPRFVLGKPTEAWDNRATQDWIPSSLSQWLQLRLMKLIDIEMPKDLVPDHNLLEQAPTVRGDFLEKIVTGLISIQRAGVSSFTESGLLLSTGKSIDVDVVICATGYMNFSLPYLPLDVMKNGDSLYKMMLSPQYDNLFLLGYIETFGPHMPLAEAQARWATGILCGKIKRPSKEEMRSHIREWQSSQAKHFVASDRHQLLVHPVSYMDDLLEPLGAAPTVRRLLGQFAPNPLATFKMFNAAWFGIPASAQYRLFGYGRKTMLAQATLSRINGDNKALSEQETQLLFKERQESSPDETV